MPFDLVEEHRMLRDVVAKFVDNELMPLEKAVLDREMSGGKVGLTEAEEAPILKKCKDLGLWGLDAPEEFGGANLPAVALMAVNEEIGRTVVPFTFPPDSPNMHMLMATASPVQRRKYLEPYARGEAKSAIAISEPGAGGDPAGMITRAVQDGDDWVINGRKIWISRVPSADFTIAMARVEGSSGRHSGITAFIIDKGTKGFEIAREIKMLGGQRTYEVVFDDCRVSGEQMLGRIGQGFAPMQLRLTVRRLQMGAWCIGMSRRALDMMCEHAKQRVTFGAKLADRQAIQWWVAEAATKIHACRLMVMDAAAKQDEGRDVRTEASMIKVFATEMATEVIDHAMQTFGAMGVTKELPLQLMAAKVRTMRVYEGPTEVHRMVIARRVMGLGR
ncbi:acyl-CoA dehydrogenase family protein [Reyranella sp. CPCC 100927]|uniref:acyl-CoA dehydrogenase family protein n=1 Tax=Reyranella sp. CPCC 100927 TaxID=2599616 RepID=UPI0011B6C69D|nr:acyl-CoA dehydrogenase family protein [Reyranella sp. CPCC 100927]TWT03201.1 acyl-CoA dehydrogenase [Reyranella sp. CPCC 100927]